MDRILLGFAAISITTLAACAPAEVRNGATAQAAGPGAQYCAKNRLATQGEKLTCNWAASKADACRFQNLASLDKAAVASEPTSAGRCDNGEWLVQVTTK